MSLKAIIILLIVLWLLNKVYKAIFPILHMASTTTNRMRQMQEQMKEMDRKMEENKASQKRSRVNRNDDYIDYEELK